MKVRRTIYIVIGSLFILFNIMADIVSLVELSSYPSDLSAKGGPYSIGYFIGSHIFLILGLVLLRLAYKVHKKIKNKNNRELNEAIDELGTRQV